MNGVERLLSLALTLSATSHGLTREELLTLVPGYRDGSPATRRRQFVRDLARVSSLGYRVVIEEDPVIASTPRYRIDSSGQERKALNATEEESAVLAAASTMWSTERGTGLLARVKAKLVAAGVSVNSVGLTGQMGAVSALDPLLEAVVEARAVTFPYRKDPTSAEEKRTIEPWKVGVVQGRPYVIGYDTARQAPRLFRISRMTGTPQDAGPARHRRDPHTDIAALVSRAESLDEGGSLTVYAEPYKALSLRALCGVTADVEQWDVPAPVHPQILEFVLKDAPWLKLSGSSAVVDEFASMCAQIAATHCGPPPRTRASLRELESVEVKRLRTVTSSEDQLARLSAEVAYVYARKSADLAHMAADFGLSTTELMRDLQVLYNSADYSDGYDNLVDVVIDDGVVTIRGAGALIHPFSLSPAEASALLLALEVLEAVSGGFSPTAIAGARRLLQNVMQSGAGDAAAEAAGERSDSAAEETWAKHTALVEAWRAGRTVRLMYSTPTRTGVSVRDVDPRHLTSRYGTVYLTGWCHLTESSREFRTDRIVGLWDPQDAQAPAPGDFTAPSALSDLDGENVLVYVRHAPWVCEAFDISRIYREPHDDSSSPSGSGYALVNTRTPHALISAVFETRGAVEIMEPARLRDAVHAIAEHHITGEGE